MSAASPLPPPQEAPTPDLPAAMPAAWRRYWVFNESSIPTAPPSGQPLEVKSGESLARAVNARDGPRVRYLRIPPLTGTAFNASDESSEALNVKCRDRSYHVPGLLHLTEHLHPPPGAIIMLDCRWSTWPRFLRLLTPLATPPAIKSLFMSWLRLERTYVASCARWGQVHATPLSSACCLPHNLSASSTQICRALSPLRGLR